MTYELICLPFPVNFSICGLMFGFRVSNPVLVKSPEEAPGFSNARPSGRTKFASNGPRRPNARTCRGCAQQLAFHVNHVSCIYGNYKSKSFHSFYIFNSSIVLILW